MDTERLVSDWVASKRIIRLMEDTALCKENLERFMIAYHNKISPNNRIDDLLMDECNRKGIKCNKDTIALIRKVLTEKKPARPPWYLLEKISTDRYEKLLSMASKERIFQCLLKYESIYPGGQQWSIPGSMYKKMVDDYDLKLEAFASPFNSQLLMYGMNFCSLFPELDKPFGSIGNFFDISGLKGTVCANPPFILDVIDAMIGKCFSDLEESNNLRYFLLLPNWTDASYHNELLNSKYLKYFTTLSGGKNSFSFKDKEKRLRCNLIFCVLSVGDHKGDPKELVDFWV